MGHGARRVGLVARGAASALGKDGAAGGQQLQVLVQVGRVANREADIAGIGVGQHQPQIAVRLGQVDVLPGLEAHVIGAGRRADAGVDLHVVAAGADACTRTVGVEGHRLADHVGGRVAAAAVAPVDNRAVDGSQRYVGEARDRVELHRAYKLAQVDAAVSRRRGAVVEGVEHAGAVVAVDVDLDEVAGLADAASLRRRRLVGHRAGGHGQALARNVDGRQAVGVQDPGGGDERHVAGRGVDVPGQKVAELLGDRDVAVGGQVDLWRAVGRCSHRQARVEVVEAGAGVAGERESHRSVRHVRRRGVAGGIGARQCGGGAGLGLAVSGRGADVADIDVVAGPHLAEAVGRVDFGRRGAEGPQDILQADADAVRAEVGDVGLVLGRQSAVVDLHVAGRAAVVAFLAVVDDHVHVVARPKGFDLDLQVRAQGRFGAAVGGQIEDQVLARLGRQVHGVQDAILILVFDQLGPDRPPGRALQADGAQVGIQFEGVGADNLDRRVAAGEDVAGIVVDEGPPDRVLDVAVDGDVRRDPCLRSVQVLDLHLRFREAVLDVELERGARVDGLGQRDVIGRGGGRAGDVENVDVDGRRAVVHHVDEVDDEIAARAVGQPDPIPGVLKGKQSGVAPDLTGRRRLAIQRAEVVGMEGDAGGGVVVDVEHFDVFIRAVGIPDAAAVLELDVDELRDGPALIHLEHRVRLAEQVGGGFPVDVSPEVGVPVRLVLAGVDGRPVAAGSAVVPGDELHGVDVERGGPDVGLVAADDHGLGFDVDVGAGIGVSAEAGALRERRGIEIEVVGVVAVIDAVDGQHRHGLVARDAGAGVEDRLGAPQHLDARPCVAVRPEGAGLGGGFGKALHTVNLGDDRHGVADQFRRGADHDLGRGPGVSDPYAAVFARVVGVGVGPEARGVGIGVHVPVHHRVRLDGQCAAGCQIAPDIGFGKVIQVHRGPRVDAGAEAAGTGAGLGLAVGLGIGVNREVL
ncbi:MAG: hypothetical protein BWX88_03622 [Planctomycetes bacterium ADurb.Bin126]|nr:MAG: hypothetical protein BWX88_03622 [Planctomycetes bacterium ADurb.Bin126]